jgi:hypothetical protein
LQEWRVLEFRATQIALSLANQPKGLDMGRDFSALNPYGHREYKFAQSDSYGRINAAVMGANYTAALANGSCMGVVLNWVKERLTTSNGLLRPDGPLLNPTTKHFSNPINPLARLDRGISPPKDSLMSKFIDKGKSGPRNESTMLAGAMTQLAYRAGTKQTVAQELGLMEGSHDQSPVIYRDPEHNIPVRVEDETIEAAAKNLPKGNAIVIELKQTGGSGHAIAFYRGRQGTLHFFDPNAGVYKVFESGSSILNFVRAWLGVYVRENSITWETPANNWYAVYNRAGN